MNNYIPDDVGDEIPYPFPNFNGATAEVWEWIRNFIPHFTGHVIIYPSWGYSYYHYNDVIMIISYLGMKSWDLHVCDRASTITHVDRVKKSNPWYNKIWLCLNVTIWSSPICLCYFHSFCYNFKISGKKFTLLSITRHCLSLFLVGSKSMLALLLFKATITPRHWNDKCFHRAGGDLICRFGICASHFQCIVGAQQEILCLTVRTTSWFDECDHGVSECQSLHDSDTVKSSKWKKSAMKTQHLVASTPFVHNQCHMTTLWYRSWLFWQF